MKNQFGVYKEIPIHQLTIDHDYQRQVNNAFVKKVTASFDESLIGAIRVVTRRNKMFAVVDGQHRLAVLKALGYEAIPCIVHPEMSFKDEVSMFHDLNQGIHKLTALEDFWSLIQAGHTDSLAILRVIERHGLKVAKRSGERVNMRDSISAIGIVKQIVKNYKLHILDETLHFVVRVWPANGEALTGQLLEGVSIFIKRHTDNPVYDENNARRKLMGLSLPVMITRARNQAKLYETRSCFVIADLLCEAYNKGLSQTKKLTWFVEQKEKATSEGD